MFGVEMSWRYSFSTSELVLLSKGLRCFAKIRDWFKVDRTNYCIQSARRSVLESSSFRSSDAILSVNVAIETAFLAFCFTL